MLEYAGLDKSGFGFNDYIGLSFDDVKTMAAPPARDLHVYFWKGIGRVDDILKYEVTGDASDYSNWKVVERFGQPADK